MHKVKVIETGPSFRPKKTIEAEVESIVEIPMIGCFLMLEFSISGQTEQCPIVKMLIFCRLAIPAEPKKLKKDRREPNELSLWELEDIIAKGGSSGMDILAYQVDLQIKLAFHLASFVVCLIGLKFGYKSERSMETAKGGYWRLLSVFPIGLS